MEIKKEDIKQEIFELYDDYAHNRLSRRDFMDKLSVYAIGSMTVPTLMSFLSPDYENSIQVKKDDPRLKPEYVNYNSEKGGGTIAQPPNDLVPRIEAPLLLHYAGLDTRVNEGWPAYESALKENNKEYTAYIYPGVNHGFHNDTTPRYDKTAAELAWKRTIDFFTAKLN